MIILGIQCPPIRVDFCQQKRNDGVKLSGLVLNGPVHLHLPAITEPANRHEPTVITLIDPLHQSATFGMITFWY